jgi:hypothetical protein
MINHLHSIDTIIFDNSFSSDTPQSPTMQGDNTNVESINLSPSTSPLYVPDLDRLIEQLKTGSLESRLQLCSLFSIGSLSLAQRRSTIDFCLDTLIDLHDNASLYNQLPSIFSITSDYCFISRSYTIYFDYILDILLRHVSPTLILRQIEHQHSSLIYPQHLLSSLSAMSLRFIYDSKLLRQWLTYVQKTSNNERRWSNDNHKRKFDDDNEIKLTDEQLIEKIIQHASHTAQWNDEQRRSTIYSYLVDERHTLLQLE